MRNTKQRKVVLDIVNYSMNHPTALDVYHECMKTLPSISLGTVYRNLNILVDRGMIRRLEIPGHIDRYDKNDWHDHFICIRCGKIVDVLKHAVSCPEQLNGNRILRYEVRYDGICCDCMELNEGE